MSGYIRKKYTVVFIREANRLLLGYKKRGFGEGRWNGFGGKVEVGETVAEGAVRELREEAGVEVAADNVEKVGDLEFTFEGQDKLMHVHVFLARAYSGTPTETEEMRPAWFSIDQLPYADMWPDDHLWYPIMLRGGKFRGNFHFQGLNDILSHQLEEVEALA